MYEQAGNGSMCHARTVFCEIFANPGLRCIWRVRYKHGKIICHCRFLSSLEAALAYVFWVWKLKRLAIIILDYWTWYTLVSITSTINNRAKKSMHVMQISIITSLNHRPRCKRRTLQKLNLKEHTPKIPKNLLVVEWKKDIYKYNATF